MVEPLEGRAMLTTISVTALEPDYVEGEMALFRIDVEGAQGAFTIAYQSSGGPAGPSSGTIDFLPGSTSAQVAVHTQDNTTPGDSYTLTLQISGSTETGASGPYGGAST